jgi:hypothetical protein
MAAIMQASLIVPDQLSSSVSSDTLDVAPIGAFIRATGSPMTPKAKSRTGRYVCGKPAPAATCAMLLACTDCAWFVMHRRGKKKEETAESDGTYYLFNVRKDATKPVQKEIKTNTVEVGDVWR